MSRRDQPITYRAALLGLAGGCIAIVTAALTFGSSVVGRAEAASRAVVSPLEQRLIRVENKLDEVLERLPPHP